MIAVQNQTITTTIQCYYCSTMKFLTLLILTSLLWLVSASPAKYAELATMKNMFYEMGITDPVTFKLVDRLVELASIPHEARDVANVTNVTNITDQVQHVAEEQLYSIPQGDIRCHKDKQLDYMSVMAAAGKQNILKLPRGNYTCSDYLYSNRRYS